MLFEWKKPKVDPDCAIVLTLSFRAILPKICIVQAEEGFIRVSHQ